MVTEKQAMREMLTGDIEEKKTKIAALEATVCFDSFSLFLSCLCLPWLGATFSRCVFLPLFPSDAFSVV